MTVDNDWWEMEGRSFVPVVWFLDERQACIQKAGVRHRVCSDDIIEHCLHRQAVLDVIYKKLSQAVNLEKRQLIITLTVWQKHHSLVADIHYGFCFC